MAQNNGTEFHILSQKSRIEGEALVLRQVLPFPDFERPTNVRIHAISPLSMAIAGRTVFSCFSVRANDCGKTVEQETTNGRGEREIICESGPKALNESHIWRVGEREGHICPHPSNPSAGEQPLDPN